MATDREQAQKKINLYSLGATIGIFVAIITIYSLVSDANKYVTDATTKLYENHKIVQNEIRRMKDIKEKEVRSLKNEIYLLKEQLKELRTNKTQNNVDDAKN